MGGDQKISYKVDVNAVWQQIRRRVELKNKKVLNTVEKLLQQEVPQLSDSDAENTPNHSELDEESKQANIDVLDEEGEIEMDDQYGDNAGGDSDGIDADYGDEQQAKEEEGSDDYGAEDEYVSAGSQLDDMLDEAEDVQDEAVKGLKIPKGLVGKGELEDAEYGDEQDEEYGDEDGEADVFGDGDDSQLDFGEEEQQVEDEEKSDHENDVFALAREN